MIEFLVGLGVGLVIGGGIVYSRWLKYDKRCVEIIDETFKWRSHESH